MPPSSRVRACLVAVVLVSELPAQGVRQPLTIVAPAAPGGGWDQLARTMQRVLVSEGLARNVNVENIPGAAGTIGLARFVGQRRGDGAALLVTGLVMVGGIAQNTSPVTLADASPIARLVGEYEAIAVPASSPHASLGDLLAAFDRDPGAVSWGGGSAGGTDQMLVDLIARARGIDPRRTSYVAFAGGGEARTALLGAQVTAGVSGVGEFAELAASGGVRILAVSSPERLPGINAPTLREAGVDLTLANWRGVMAPPSLRPAARRDLERLVLDMTRTSGWRAELDRRGWQDLALGSDAFGRFVTAESNRVAVLAAARRGTDVASIGSRSRVPLVLLAGLLIFLIAGFRANRRRSAEQPPVSPGNGITRGRARVGLILGAVVANMGLSEPAGFLPGATILFAATATAFGERPLWRVVVVGAVFSAVVLGVFRGMLDVALPLGAWWPQ